jgi:hypothetical protein
MSQSLVVPPFSTNPVQWAEAQWGGAELGDKRRTRRAVRLGAAIAAQSAASLPTEGSGGIVLFVQDTSDLNFSSHEALEGRGHTSDGSDRGFLLHSCLAVIPENHNSGIVGLAYQTVWARERILKGSETLVQRKQRRNEADIWAETLEAIGMAPTGSRPKPEWH